MFLFPSVVYFSIQAVSIRNLFMFIWLTVIAAAAIAVTATAVPSGSSSNVTPLPAADGNATAGVPLRIMPVGASTAYGVGSSTGSGYRKALRDLLVAAGNTVVMVGEAQHGDFADNACEAFPGYTLDQIAEKVAGAVPRYKPNLVLVDAGGNDCNRGVKVADGGAKMSKMISGVFSASPGATVVLQTLIAIPDTRGDECRVDLNKQFRAVVEDLAGKGAKIVVVDMRSPEGLTTRDLADSRHPNDAGFVKMANVWFKGIQIGISKGFL